MFFWAESVAEGERGNGERLGGRGRRGTSTGSFGVVTGGVPGWEGVKMVPFFWFPPVFPISQQETRSD